MKQAEPDTQTQTGTPLIGTWLLSILVATVLAFVWTPFGLGYFKLTLLHTNYIGMAVCFGLWALFHFGLGLKRSHFLSFLLMATGFTFVTGTIAAIFFYLSNGDPITRLITG